MAPGEVLLCLSVAMSLLMVMVSGQDLACPVSKVANTGDKSTADVTWPLPTGSGLSSVRCVPPTGSALPIGITTVTCSAQNTIGNTVTCTFRVTVNDNQNPEFTTCPTAVRKTLSNFKPMDGLSSLALAVTWDDPSTKDNAGQVPQTSYTHESGTEFELGSTSVKYTTRDNAGNTDTCSFDVQVVVQPPSSHVFAKAITTQGFTVVWPQSEDGAVQDYSILIWKIGAQKPGPSQRIPVTPTEEDRKYTYVETTVNDLEPAELYNVEVSSETSTVVSSTQQWTRPMPPSNLEATVLSPTSLELSWTASPGDVEQYKVYGQNGYIMYVPKGTDRVTLKSLDPGLSGSGFVRAVVGSGKTRLESAIALVPIITGPVNDSQLIAYNYTESTIAVVWKASVLTTDPNEPYMLLINPPDAEKNYLAVFGLSSRAEFKGLKPNMEYQIKLISNLGLSLGTSQKTRPGRVRNLRPTAVANDSITLEWDPPTEGDFTSYEVQISPAGTQNEPVMQSDTSRSFTDLTYGTEYRFSVVSVHDDAESVTQTLMVTAGITKAVTETLNQTAIIVGSVLGVFVLVLAIVLGATCLKYCSLKRREAPTTGRTNEAVAPDNGYQAAEGTDQSLYEVPVIGQQRAAQKAPPTVKAKPNLARR